MVKTGRKSILLKKPRDEDDLKAILEKFKFTPEFIPSTRELLNQGGSIHDLKMKRMESKEQKQGK